MPKRSAGLLMYRRSSPDLEVFLVHPGGPFWARKDFGAWSIPKGEYAAAEPAVDAAMREFQEETGFAVAGELIQLGAIQQNGGKIVSAWAFEGDCDPAALVSNLCRLQWPPRSGAFRDFPEIDRGAWFSLPAAAERILPAQRPFLTTLAAALHLTSASSPEASR
jgi:predicted NUDIX family NTP pyrophosphohydrolase